MPTLLNAFCVNLGYTKQTTTYLVLYTCSLQRAIHFMYVIIWQPLIIEIKIFLVDAKLWSWFLFIIGLGP